MRVMIDQPLQLSQTITIFEHSDNTFSITHSSGKDKDWTQSVKFKNHGGCKSQGQKNNKKTEIKQNENAQRVMNVYMIINKQQNED